MTEEDAWAFVVCDELEKVFPDLPPRARDPRIPQTTTLGERASVQLAYRSPGGAFRDSEPLVRPLATGWCRVWRPD